MKSLFSILSLALLFLNCSSTKNITPIPLPPGEKVLIIQGKLTNIPSIFKKEKYTFEIRYYNCESLDFGKKKADSGHYPRLKNDCRDKFLSQKLESTNPNFKFETKTP
ncbi:MAG: hypothetical protein KDK36_22375, partial [Leptospiraceae bacterium]|nr:hypothetical protein [Leptospiraceae bacterium]